ncbi:MAG: DUF5615 family PIN-like protein [Deltaproteobacteria bacterium]|nr:DUF5615 family PIN-like protein [Deltaproteobacteria bacterium]
MKIFVDENVPLITIGAIREIGHDVLDIRGTKKEGMVDDTLWDMVQQSCCKSKPCFQNIPGHFYLVIFGTIN